MKRPVTHDRYSRRILEHIADRRYQPQKIEALAHDLGVPPEELDDFRRSVEQLVSADGVVLGSSETVALPPPGREMIGVFRKNERGFGFLVPDHPTEHGDLFIPAGSTADALTGDRVKAKVRREAGREGGARSPYVGQIVEVIQRSDRKFVGNLVQRGSLWVVQIDGKAMREPIIVRDPHAKNAKAGDKVVIEILTYPSEGEPGEGVITQVLGEGGEPDVETMAVMHAYGLAGEFQEEIVRDARQAAESFRAYEKTVPPDREDLTNTFICTIDPPDAKDFDDAISIRRLSGEAEAVWELGVHIADVSFFVKTGSPLDVEAKKRGNSAYLPRKVVPMLPELLSNGVCSLQEGVNRFTKSAFIRFDREGHVVGTRFSNSVIRSAKRMTYMEAQALIGDDLREAVKHAKTSGGEPKYPRQLIETLKLMDELAKVIRERRLRDGMIVLGLPDVELVFDASGRVSDAVPEDESFTHTIIEMFMVEANEALARLFDSQHVPMIRRIHADPDAHDITELRQFARVAGYNIPARPSRKELQGLLDAVRGKPQQHAVHLAVLKTLSRAEYSPLLIGHFALASHHYTHFTSPIRRYPDLIVHRGLEAYLDAVVGLSGKSEIKNQKSEITRLMREDPRVPSEEQLVELGRHCSTTERNAESAEKDLRAYLVLELLAAHLGDDFQGTVTGVTGAGVFVQLDKFLQDGFVRINDLPGSASDRWRLNRVTGALVAQRSGKTITIGDRFVVRIAKVEPHSRQLELVVIEAAHGSGGGRKSGGGDGEGKGKTKQHRAQPQGAAKSHQKSMKFKLQRKSERQQKRRRFR